jgi:hypothetical protein
MYRSTFSWPRTSWRWVVSFTSWSLYPRRKSPGTHCIGGWVGPRAGLDDVEKRKFFTLPGLELWPLGRPAHSQSLYRPLNEWVGQSENRGSIPHGDRDLFLVHSDQTDCGSYSATYQWEPGALCHGLSDPQGAKLTTRLHLVTMMKYANTRVHQCIFMAWCSFKHRHRFTLLQFHNLSLISMSASVV